MSVDQRPASSIWNDFNFILIFFFCFVISVTNFIFIFLLFFDFLFEPWMEHKQIFCIGVHRRVSRHCQRHKDEGGLADGAHHADPSATGQWGLACKFCMTFFLFLCYSWFSKVVFDSFSSVSLSLFKIFTAFSSISLIDESHWRPLSALSSVQDYENRHSKNVRATADPTQIVRAAAENNAKPTTPTTTKNSDTTSINSATPRESPDSPAIT